MFARLVALLTVVNLSLCCAGTQRKLTQSTAAPAPVGPSIVSDLFDVLGRNQSIGTRVIQAPNPRRLASLQLPSIFFALV